jgi:Ca-activated chloride channel family protein
VIADWTSLLLSAVIMMIKRGIPIVCCAALMIPVAGQTPHRQLRNGDLFYDQGEFLEAEESYRKANEARLNPQAQYNLGNAIYQQQRYDEAVKHYESAAETATNPLMKAQAYHNLGNTHYRAQALDKSIEAYRNALKLNPEDLDTKKNLTLALQQLRQQQQQQPQQQPGGDEDKQEQPQPQEQPQQTTQQQETGQQDEQPPEPSDPVMDLTREEAEELLRIIDADDSRVQEKLRKTSSNTRRSTKDW